MKFLSWLITIPLVVFCVVFAVNNRQEVTIDLWPSGYVASAPLYLVTLGASLVGFLIGALLFWLASLHPRWERRHLARQVDRLKHELLEEKVKSSNVPVLRSDM
ncbi:MAG: LapA family protein [Proteobacteria bacterium]|nr:LapA family protein [Pseudomonadota bacterium]